jgi:hypothetical protein
LLLLSVMFAVFTPCCALLACGMWMSVIAHVTLVLHQHALAL